MYEVQRVPDRILLLRMVVGKVVFAFICVYALGDYAPRAGLSVVEKDRFLVTATRSCCKSISR